MTVLLPIMNLLGPQRRDLLLGQHCAGMGPGGAVFEACGISFRELFASDPKVSAHAFRAAYGCQKCERHYNNIREVIASPPRERPDIEVSGFPCQPFSTMRTGRFTDQAPTDHEAYSVSDDLLLAMSITRPRCAIVEQVKGFAMSQNGGPSELDAFIKRVNSYGLWHHMVMTVQLSPWVGAARDRIYILLVDRDSGERETLDRALQIARLVVHHRRTTPPTPLATFWLPAYHRNRWAEVQVQSFMHAPCTLCCCVCRGRRHDCCHRRCPGGRCRCRCW